MKSKVVVIGLGKTGTSTLGVCLKTLGYKHVTGPYDQLEAAQRNHFSTLLGILADHDSADDFPWPYVYRAVDTHFPGTRFILSERRDAETWLDSLKRHYDRTGPSKPKLLAYGSYSPYGREAEHIALYQRHGRDVRAYFADRPRDLLVFRADAGDGWQQLCDFLGEPVPDIPFPHGNRDRRNPVYRAAESLVAQDRLDEAFDVLQAAMGEPVDQRVKVMARAVEFASTLRGRKIRCETVPDTETAAIRTAVHDGAWSEAVERVIANRSPDFASFTAFKDAVTERLTD